MYFQAFGYELPADLTWHMVDYLEPRIYYRELTHQETPEELDAIEREVRALLQPGDLVVYDRGVGSGHIVMCIDDDRYTDCNPPLGEPNSYDYTNHKNNIYGHGGIWIHSLDRLFARDTGQTPPIRTLFHSSTRRFAIARPLELLGKPTEQTQIRMNQAQDLWCAVENSAPGCRQACPGKTLEYTVIIRNLQEQEREVTVTFAPPAGTRYEGEAKAYGALAIGLEPQERRYCSSRFFLHDSTKGDVLSRRPQKHFDDLAVYGGFGGRGVITPEMATAHGMRLTHITRADLLPGDLLLCMDDGCGRKTYSCFYDGERLTGRFEADGQACTLREEELDSFVDSLFGRYAFLLLRPGQGCQMRNA